MIWGRGHHRCDSLRQWFGHDPAEWVEFKKRYSADLDRRAESWQPLRESALRGLITLVFGATDVRHNQAVALKEYPESKKPSPSRLNRRAREPRRGYVR